VCEYCRLVPKIKGGFQILVDPGRAPSAATRRRRLRFRLAHEPGHSFFYDRRPRPARRLLNHSSVEEQFCDTFASALLLPPTTVARRPATLETILDLSNKLDVSVQLVGSAVARTNAGSFVLGLPG
jgi:hypothetical protein